MQIYQNFGLLYGLVNQIKFAFRQLTKIFSLVITFPSNRVCLIFNFYPKLLVYCMDFTNLISIFPSNYNFLYRSTKQAFASNVIIFDLYKDTKK